METQPDKEDPLPMPMLTPKSQTGSQRVIKQIMVIDPNKLRMAGLDIKMAEALKKSKPKNVTKSKEDKLAKAKSLLNKKLKEALMKKDGKSLPTLPQTPQKVKSVEEVSRKLSFSKPTKSVTPKQKLKDSTSKTLMPPPSSPVVSNQTMEIRVLKPDKTKQSIEVKIIDPSKENAPKIDKFPKASLKKLEEPVAPETKLEENKPPLSKDLPIYEFEAKTPSPSVPFNFIKEKKVRKSRKESVKQKESFSQVRGKSLPKESEPEPSTEETIDLISLPIEAECSEGELTIDMPTQEEYIILEVEESSMEMPSFTTIHNESPTKVTESLKQIITFTPQRRESLPTVIESIVLSAEDKIDLSILTKKSPLIVPKKRHKHEQNWLSLTPNQEPVCINVSPVAKATTPPKPEHKEESAVDFINNLSNLFATSQKSKAVPEIITKECGEDATSFLMSLYEKKKDESLTVPTSNAVNNEEQATQPSLQFEEQHDKEEPNSVNTPYSTNNLPSPGQHLNSVVSSDSLNSQTHNIQNSTRGKSNKQNMQQIELSFVKALHESLGINTDSKSMDESSLQSGKTSIQTNKSMTSDSKKGKQSIEPASDFHQKTTDKSTTNAPLKESSRLIEPPSDPPQSILRETPNPENEAKKPTDISKESVPQLSATLVSSRRKGAKPIPVLIPKLKKSRKPPTNTQKPPEETKDRSAPEKNTEKPAEESPTQPVKSAGEVKSTILSESTSFQVKEAQTASQKLQQKPRASPEVTAKIPEEPPTTSKSGRPLRQRKISLKLLEQEIKDSVPSESTDSFQEKSKNITTASQKSLRKRGDIPKPGIFEESQGSIVTSLHSRDSAEIIEESLSTTNKSGRPQRRRKITFKLLESSESLPTVKGFNSSIGQEKSKETKNSENTTEKPLHIDDSDDIIAIEVKDNASIDPIAQLLAFHETVEKFELACGLVRPTETPNPTSNSIGHGSTIGNESLSVPANPSCGTNRDDSFSTNNSSFEGKENVSGKLSSTKSTRKRKDSLKSRRFAAEDISIVYGESMENLDAISRLQTPNTSTDTNMLEPLQTDKAEQSAMPGDELQIETTTDLSTQKRRGRPPKTPHKMEAAAEKNIEISKQPSETATENIVEVSKSPIEVYKNSNLGGSWETLYSDDEKISNTDSIGSRNAKKKRGRSKLNRSKTKGSTDITEDEAGYIPEDNFDVQGIQADVNEVDDIIKMDHSIQEEEVPIQETDPTRKILEENLTTEKNNTPKTAKRRGRPPKTPKTEIEQKTELNSAASALINSDESIQEVVNEEDTEIVSALEADVEKVVKIIRPIKIGSRHSKSSASSIESMPDSLGQGRTPRSRKQTSKFEEYTTNRNKAINRTSVNSDECFVNETEIDSDDHQKPQSTLITSDPSETSETTTGPIEASSDLCNSETHSMDVDQSALKDNSIDHLSSPTKSKTSDTEVDNDKDSSSNQSPSENNLSDTLKTSLDIQTSDVASSKPLMIESQVSEKPAISKDDLFEELKTSKPQPKVNESEQATSGPTKHIPEFEDLLFDLDNIESPSFSPIGENALADDSDGFEELDDELTLSIIETVRTVEKSAEEPKPEDFEQSLSLGSSVPAKISPDNTSIIEEAAEQDGVQQSTQKSSIVLAQKSPEGAKLEANSRLEEVELNPSNLDEAKQSPSLHLSSVLDKDSPGALKSTEEPNPDEVMKCSLLNPDVLVNKPHEYPTESTDKAEQSPSVGSSVLEEKSPETTKNNEKPISNEESISLPSSVLAKNSPKDSKNEETQQTPEVNVNKPSEDEKLDEEAKPGEVGKCSVPVNLSPDNQTHIETQKPDLASPEKHKPSETPRSDELKKSSALYTYAHAKSDQKQEKLKKKEATNPFKKQVPKEQESAPCESDNKSETSFLGFNEEEIEEGQQSTSLRLSQSEDVESPSTSATSPKRSRKKSKVVSGRKQKQDKVDWERNSAKSLKNWLATPAIGGGVDACDIKETKTNEQNSSVPPKKRTSRVPNSIISIHLQNDTHPTKKSVTKADESVDEENITPSDKKENPKRKYKLKNIPEAEDNPIESITTPQKDDGSSSPKSKPTSKRCKTVAIVDKESATDETPKRGQKLNDIDNKPKRGRKPRVPKGLVNDEDLSENLPLSVIKKRSRKRSVSEANTPTTTTAPEEPPSKRVQLEADILSTSLFQGKRKIGRPSKLEGTIHGPPKEDNVIATLPSPPEKKYKSDVEFNPRLLLIRKKEELKSDEPLVDPSLQTEPQGPDDVQCALCMGYASKKKWFQHVGSHYGIGWIVGHPPPLNIKSRSSILNFLIDFFRVSKVKGLNCRLCNSLRRSGLGLLVHLEQCCLTNEELANSRVDCEYCKKKYSKQSYPAHKRTCSVYLKQVFDQKQTECSQALPEGEAPDDILSNTGRLKRKSVIKAEEKLKNLDDTEFIPDELIKHIPSTQSADSLKEKWLEEINAFGKGFCANKRCQFTATTVEDLIDHHEDFVCPHYIQPGYFCVKCKFHNNEIEPVRSHVIKKHKPKIKGDKDVDAEIGSSDSSDSISSGDDEDGSDSFTAEDGERKPRQKKKSGKTAKRRRHEMKHPPTKDYRKLLPERRIDIQEIILDEFKEFIKTHFSLDPLFSYAKPNPSFIEVSESYFPKSMKSMKFFHNGFTGFVKTLGHSKVEPEQWKHLERLQGFSQNSEHTIYMGGPVKSLAWVPLEPHPPTNIQYLAVTVRKDIDKFTRFVNQKRSRSLIFILEFDISDPLEIKAEISYAVAIDEGPIHAIEFLPSGGYAPEMNRLGMLAVGTIETEIKIYSLPLKVEKRDCDIFPIVRLEASFELHLRLSDNPSENSNMYCSQCTCLTWSKSAGHNIIFGGFLNGFTGIWDISDDADNLNRFVVNETRRFIPVSYFWTAEDRLMHFAVHYDINGPRWLAVLNSTRKILFYELRDITHPMLFRVEVTINNVNSIEWPIFWENVMFGLGDTMPSNGCVLTGFSPLSIMYTNRRFDKFCTGVTAMHYNMWRNSFAAGTDNGDIHVMPLREGVLDVAQRLKIDEKTISTLDIVALNGDQISQTGIQMPSDGMRVFDKENKDQYGLVFGSIKRYTGGKYPEYYDTERVPPLNLNRLMRVSQIKFNPNENACDVLAVGYDNGLLRVHIHDWLKTRR